MKAPSFVEHNRLDLLPLQNASEHIIGIERLSTTRRPCNDTVPVLAAWVEDQAADGRVVSGLIYHVGRIYVASVGTAERKEVSGVLLEK